MEKGPDEKPFFIKGYLCNTVSELCIASFEALILMLLDYKRIAPRLRTESALLPVRYESNERLLESIDDPMRFLKDAEGDLMLMML